MNSALYECNIMHCRIKPRRHKFNNRIFMFYLDLDEIDAVSASLGLISRNRWNLFSFRDDDHLQLGAASAKENILKYVQSQGLREKVSRVMLLTDLRVLGYVFNPVSFYFCFDDKQRPLCAVLEIGNTFGELKPFFMGPERIRKDRFEDRQTKYFYISPFVDLDVPMDFQIAVPGERLNIKIDDVKDGEKFLYTTMSGPRRELTKANLWRYALRFPFVTLQVIFLIHLHALILYLKKIPYHAKEDHLDMQKGVYRAWVKK